MEFKININIVNDKVEHLKTLLAKEKEKEEKSREMFEKVQYAQYLVREIELSRRQTESNLSEAKKIWETLTNGTNFSIAILFTNNYNINVIM